MLSEEGLVVYKIMFDDIKLIKKQQWNITNYAALLYGAIVVFTKELHELSVAERSGLIIVTAVVAVVSSLFLKWTQDDLSNIRTRLASADRAIFTAADERTALGLEPETEPSRRGLEFTMPMLGVIWLGAAMVAYYLGYKAP